MTFYFFLRLFHQQAASWNDLHLPFIQVEYRLLAILATVLPSTHGAKTNRAGKDLPQHFSTGDKVRGVARLNSGAEKERNTGAVPRDSWAQPCLLRAGAPTAKATAPARHQKPLYRGECKRGKGPLELGLPDAPCLVSAPELESQGGSRLAHLWTFLLGT